MPSEVLALELLLGPAAERSPLVDGLLAVHVAGAPPGDFVFEQHLDLVAEIVNRRGEIAHRFWSEVMAACSPKLALSGDEPVRRVSFISLNKESDPRASTAMLAAYALVSAATADRLADLRKRADRHQFTLTRPDWSVLVLRDGAAFIAHQVSDEPFAATLRVQVHSVHLDAILLALIQRRLVDQSGDEAVSATLDRPDHLSALEKSHFDFKRRYWRTSLTDKRTAPSDEIFRAFQNELLTPLDVGDVEERVQEGARVARTLHAERVDEAQWQLTRTVQNATVIVGALGLAYTAAPVLDEPSWKLFLLATGAGLMGVLAAFVTLVVTGRRARRGGAPTKAGRD